MSRQIDQNAWLRAYLSEIERTAQETPNRLMNSIFFGGGTPSLMLPDTVAAIIECARKHWTFANDIEITLEANPGSVEAGRFSGYRDGGVNRISMGFQAMNDQDLRRLGRIHTVDEALAAFDIARNCFDRVSFDLIYARQDQSLSDWESELKQALSLAIDHLSLYQLTIESGTAFGDRYAAGKLLGLPDDDNAADMYFLTQEVAERHGFPSYEISNHARPGAESRHNLIYWRYGDYIGIGPGAHGRITLNGQKFATECPKSPSIWLSDVSNGNGESHRSLVTPLEQAEEYIMMGMRLSEGLDIGRFAEISGFPLSTDKLNYLQELDMVRLEGTKLSATANGRPVLNAVLRELLAD